MAASEAASLVTAKIRAALRRNAEIEADSIEIDVSGCTVILYDTANAWTGHETAGHAAWSTAGVTQVTGARK